MILKRADPMSMANQPALQTSSGLIWLVVGAIFAALSLVPLGLLIFGGSGKSRGVAIGVAVLVLCCYALIVVARIARPRGPGRLRLMAVGLLTMAGVALVGIWLCALIEGTAIPPGLPGR